MRCGRRQHFSGELHSLVRGVFKLGRTAIHFSSEGSIACARPTRAPTQTTRLTSTPRLAIMHSPVQASAQRVGLRCRRLAGHLEQGPAQPPCWGPALRWGGHGSWPQAPPPPALPAQRARPQAGCIAAVAGRRCGFAQGSLRCVRRSRSSPRCTQAERLLWGGKDLATGECRWGEVSVRQIRRAWGRVQLCHRRLGAHQYTCSGARTSEACIAVCDSPLWLPRVRQFALAVLSNVGLQEEVGGVNGSGTLQSLCCPKVQGAKLSEVYVQALKR